MARYSLSFTTEELIEWLRAKGVDEEDCSKIRAAKFRGVTFIRMEKEEHFKEMGLPVGTRLLLEELVKQAKSDIANPSVMPVVLGPANTGPIETGLRRQARDSVGLTANNLSRELESVVEWKKLGVALDVPTSEMEKMVRNYPRDVDGQKLSLFGYVEKNHKRLGITWESVCEALEGFEGNLAFQLREKYCNKETMRSNSSENELSEDPNRLGLRHMRPIIDAVYDVRSKWRFFGLELDLLAPELDAIDARCRGAPEECLRMVIESWLQRESPRPTFRAVLDGLRSPQVNYGTIAGTIERLSEDKKQRIGFYL